MEISGMIVGGVMGAAMAGAITWLVMDRLAKAAAAGLRTQVAVAEQKIADLMAQVTAAQSAGEKRVADLRGQMEMTAIQAESVRGQLSAAENKIATLAAQYAAAQQNMAEQKKLLDDANARLTQSFAAVSLEALNNNNVTFLKLAEEKFKTLSTEASGSLDQRKTAIEGLLKPMQELLNQYQLRITDVEKSRNEGYAALREQLGSLSQVQSTLTTQTTQLVSALTRPNVRGQWGEIALRKLVELAGLTARCDFSEQLSLTTDDKTMRPDMVIHLPNKRQVVIDAKAVLGAFLDAAAAGDEASRQNHLKRHAGLVRARAVELSSKAYWNHLGETPEFVVLFLPGESFLYAACDQDPALLEDCIARHVILATPTTLIALLKTIEYGWRQEALSKNAEEIRDLGKEIYDRLTTLADGMMKLGRSLDNAVDHYNKTVGTLETRVLVSARKIAELGGAGGTANEALPAAQPVEKRAREMSTTLFPE